MMSQQGQTATQPTTPQEQRQTPRTLSHFALLRFTASWWQLAEEERRRQREALREALSELGDARHLYQVFPAQDSADLLLWTALQAATPESVHTFFRDYAARLARFRGVLTCRAPLWGFTRPSTYTRCGRRRRWIPSPRTGNRFWCSIRSSRLPAGMR